MSIPPHLATLKLTSIETSILKKDRILTTLAL